MPAISSVANLEIEDNVAVLTIDSPPVNALSHSVREAIVGGLEQANADPIVQAIVLACAGKTFIAGADITEFGKPLASPNLLEVEERIERSRKPVIAAIHGTALGGGFEVALCCHYRIAVPSAKCGLPEVHLGLIPGAGGTQRLPRLVGVEMALEMMLTGKHVAAQALKQAGVLDELAREGRLREDAIEFAKRVARKLAAREQTSIPRVRDLNERILEARNNMAVFATARKDIAKKSRGFIAPEYAIRAVQAAVEKPFDEGMQVERELFGELMRSDQSAAQRYVFFAERQVWKIPDVPESTPTLAIKKIGIVGAGTMGGGIAMNFANVGLPVTIMEAEADALARGLSVIRKNYESSAKRGRITEQDVEKRMGLLEGTLDMQALADCDLIVEAVFENMEVKKDVFARLDRIARPGALLATNTSALNIDEIASATKRPEDVLGLHFFSPANVMRLLEVVRAQRTSLTAIATAMQLAKRIGKVGVLVRVCPGFVGNRMLFARQDQAQAMLMEGAMPWDIDKVLYDFGLPMGPFAMADLAGLDLGWKKESSRSATIREVLCEMNRRGQKTRAGYYDYDEQRNAKPSPITQRVVEEFMRKTGSSRRELQEQEILERLIYPMINEGAKILEEGIALRPSDIDIVWINGYGWPAYRGGPMYYADSIGLKTVVEKLKLHGPKLGPAFSVSSLLKRLAAQGKKFSELHA
jgi:3-hydroxyacyl-CoA dehydrogenase